MCTTPVGPAHTINVGDVDPGTADAQAHAIKRARPARTVDVLADVLAARESVESLSGSPAKGGGSEPAARAEAPMPEQILPVESELTPPTELPRVEPGRDVGAAGVPVQGTQVKPGGPQLPAAGESEPSQSPQAKRQPQQPLPATQPEHKPKRKPGRKAGPGRERIYNHEAITGAGNRVLARGRPDTKALFFEKVIAECRAAQPKIKLPSNIDVDDSLLRRVVGKLYDDVLDDDVKDERHN